jgi:hypothetical protein
MKLPNWLVTLLIGLSAFTILLCVAWWWITWPDRTLAEFERLVADRDFAAARAVISPPPGDPPVSFDLEAHLPILSVTPKHKPSPAELLLGIRRFGNRPHGESWLVARNHIIVADSCFSCHGSL